MSPDEVVALLVSSIIAIWIWGRWYWHLIRLASVGAPVGGRLSLALLPPACGVLLLAVLASFASFDVRDSPMYLGFYLIMGVAFVALSLKVSAVLGVHWRLDALERRNPAASVLVGGALIGLTLCFAGGNIGDGPGWWVVVFCAILSTASLLLLWGLVEWATHCADAITIDRDLASGLRHGAFLVAAGAILGRSVAGNWVAVDRTIHDFAALAWTSLPLALAAAILQRLFQPRPHWVAPSPLLFGVVPGLMYIGIAVIIINGAGPW